MVASLRRLRQEYHQELIDLGVLAVTESGVASNADSSQKTSKAIALSIAEQLGVKPGGEKLAGQTAGHVFEATTTRFLSRVLAEFSHIVAPGTEIEHVVKRGHGFYLAEFVPYLHLKQLAGAVESDPTLSTVLGNSYDISPDVIMTKAPQPDAYFNDGALRVDDSVAALTPRRLVNNEAKFVEAIISCKWTLRSDRAQNARSEALNIIRNRKGRTPHIVVVTGEPTPSRLASLALGTGDIDMVYHFALPELQKAVAASGNDEAASMLEVLLQGNRLRDISDLLIDLVE
ncbi:NgoMIV family type II restriction endonuclease [Rothia nasimurium]|uniref:NgoMIV family type II restriction endonuclease n=1 Tax=Rothia nasimurium TaxID=85336 RepID=UPI001F1E7BD9|nr:NgoMIV family type II restriction endonuclease [Rothia nasimurium]